MPSVFVQGRPVGSYPRLAPEAQLMTLVVIERLSTQFH